MHLFTFLKSYISTKYRYFNSREALRKWQDKQVVNHLKHILPSSAFYRELYHGLDPNQWRDFPIIAKKEMMENFDRLNCVGIDSKTAFSVALNAEVTRDFSPNINGISVGLSSGTSGNRGLFLASPHERMTWAGAILAKVLPHTILASTRIALFLRANSNLYTTLNSKRIHFEYYDTFTPIEAYVERLNQQQPDILAAPPSTLRLLANMPKCGIAPKKVISIAEVLDPLDQKLFENRFQQPIHQIYQATEGFLGTTCRYGTLHLNEDLLVIQKMFIDPSSNRFYPIITDFNRTSQPILRYVLNDILIEKTEPCPCGSILTAIERIDGRSDDTFYLIPKKQCKFLIPIYPDFIRREIISADENIKEYFAVQLSPKKIEIFLHIAECFKLQAIRNVQLRLKQLFDLMGAESPHIDFIDFHLRHPQKKLRRIERRFSIMEANQC